MILLLLTATALAGVVGDAEDIPRDFKNEPRTGIYERDSQKKKAPAATSGSLKNSVVTDGAVVRSSPSKRKKRAKKNRKNRRGLSDTVAEKRNGEQAKRGDFPQIPGGRDAWPLLAIAILLLVAAGGGGYYFYQQSEE